MPAPAPAATSKRTRASVKWNERPSRDPKAHATWVIGPSRPIELPVASASVEPSAYHSVRRRLKKPCRNVTASMMPDMPEPPPRRSTRCTNRPATKAPAAGTPQAQEPRSRAHGFDDVAGPITERHAGEERAQPAHPERHGAGADADDGAQQEEMGLLVAQECDETARRPFREAACFGQHRQPGKAPRSGFHGPPAGRQRARDIDLACMKSSK